MYDEKWILLMTPVINEWKKIRTVANRIYTKVFFTGSVPTEIFLGKEAASLIAAGLECSTDTHCNFP